MSAPDISTREGLFAVMRQLAKEREEAKPRVAELMARKELPWDEEIPQEWRTAGFVEELTKAVAAMVEQDPPKSLQLFQFCLSVAVHVTSFSYPEIVEAYRNAKVSIEMSYTYRLLTSYDETMRCLVDATRHIASHPALIYEIAIIDFMRATTLGFQRSLNSAEELIQQCQKTFEDFGDTKRSVRCAIIRANISVWRGDLVAAQAQFKDLLAPVEGDDLHTRGTVYNGLGMVSLKLGELQLAESALGKALAIYTEANMPSEVDRMNWSLGNVHLEKGDVETALRLLRASRAGFLAREMIEDAGLAGLDIVDALLTKGATAEARSLTEQVLDEFRSAEMSRNAISAVAYLRDFLPARGSRETVRSVKSFVEDVRVRGNRLFLPPPEDS